MRIKYLEGNRHKIKNPCNDCHYRGFCSVKSTDVLIQINYDKKMAFYIFFINVLYHINDFI